MNYSCRLTFVKNIFTITQGKCVPAQPPETKPTCQTNTLNPTADFNSIEGHDDTIY